MVTILFYNDIHKGLQILKSVPLKWAGCIYLLLFSLSTAAQKADTVTTIKGQVTDPVTGKPLIYVNVRPEGSANALVTDSAGKFNFSRPGAFAKVTFSRIGYQAVVKTVKPGQVNDLHISMHNNQNQLKEVLITSKKQKYRNKDNPAVSLIQQIINHKNENRMESAAYLQYDQYERIGLSFFNLPQKFINGNFFKKYQFMLDTMVDANGNKQTLLPALLTEKLSEVYYRKQPEKTIQILHAEKGINIIKFVDTAGVNVYLNQLYGNNLDIYENNIFIISNQFLSPIADHSPNYYKFFITDTISTPTGKQVEVSFVPRTKGDLLFEGKLTVTLDGHYAVTACQMDVNKQINVSFLRSLNIMLNFTQQANGRYQLARSDVKADFGLSKTKGWGVIGQRTVSYSNYKLDTPQSEAFYNGKSLQVALHGGKTDTAYWSSHRTDTLSKQQARVYSNLHKLEQMPSYKRTMWWLSTLTGGYADSGPVQIGPIGQFFSFNSQEGLRFEGGARSTPKLDSTFYFQGYAAIGTKDKKAKVDAITYIALNKTAPYRFPNDYFSLSYLYDVDVPGHTFSITNKQAAFSSFQTGKTNYWLYSGIFQVKYVKDFENHFSYNITFKNWNQSPAAQLVYQMNDAAGTLVNNLTTSEIDLHLRYAPHEQIIQGTEERHSIHNKYPIFDFQLNRGLKGFMNGAYTYTDAGLNIYKRFYFSQLGFADVTVIGGYVQGKLPFPLLNISPANQSFAYNRDAYNQMNYLEFVSDHYAGINFTHTFNGFLLNKIPLIQHLKWKEFISAKILYGGLRAENNPELTNGLYRLPPATNGAYGTYALGSTPYVEAGVGIGNILHFLRVDVIRRFNYLDHPGASAYGVKFSFQPEF
ncbi:carboxypeptidase-like regulatory domain-containing protein [Mucilaginibacter corticis]|uniref:Carboxypeptidase-like regulatory domain-containing protein n=1 Tax=Mucilaginibacter corticis TaxID=2597670 RepID=A0A556MTJ9_9SPHI|nr:DUF5686 and carboxypeptidase-like regulatory domain-containing protein [Mucilaginibacter corticis]TSJ43261.1 carboxypeptidase-like regulatory domain-containing protein [Mucilaginibacter corticis]